MFQRKYSTAFRAICWQDLLFLTCLHCRNSEHFLFRAQPTNVFVSPGSVQTTTFINVALMQGHADWRVLQQMDKHLVQTLLKGHAEAVDAKIFHAGVNEVASSCIMITIWWKAAVTDFTRVGIFPKGDIKNLIKSPTFHFVKHLFSCHNFLLLLLTSPNTTNIYQ